MDQVKESFPDFQSKVVVFYLANVPYEHATPLESPIFEYQANRLFIVGRKVTDGSDTWSGGAHVSIAWDQVIQYLVFESVEDYLSRYNYSTGGFFGFFARR